jgi:hypothetical protein
MEHLIYLNKANKNVENIKEFKLKINILNFLSIGFDEDYENEKLDYNYDVLKSTIDDFLNFCEIKKYAIKEGVIYYNKKLTIKQQAYIKGYRSAYMKFGGI